MIKPAEFKWKNLSKRQAMMMTWWCDKSPYKDKEGIIADGAIRSGKTVSMGLSYVMWATKCFNGQNFIMAGKTIESLRRNVINTLKMQLKAEQYSVYERKTENMIIVKRGYTTNYFYLFGGKDERSQDLVQGITAAGAFFDEVALMPESFVNQATARCSVDGSKFWFNCNPLGPLHWFYVKWIKQIKTRNMIYLHFTMDDNLTLTPRIRARYEAQYSGVFYQRYIKGLWVAADGLIYDMFRTKEHVLNKDEKVRTDGDYFVSCDFGIQNATVFLLWRKEAGTDRWICLNEYYYSGRENKAQKTVKELVDGLVSILPIEHSVYTGKDEMVMPRQVIVDPSAAALIVELRKRKFHVIPAINNVLDGISDVATMLQQNKLTFASNCKGVINEFGVYCWDEKAAQHGEDKPTKENDHAMDAVRYFVETRHLVRKMG